MKNLTAILVFSIIFGLNGFSQNDNSFFLLEKAGKQRMLCEQITKDYLMIVSNLKLNEAKAEIVSSKSEFNENVNFLFKNLDSEVTREAITKVSDKWIDFKEKINNNPNTDDLTDFIKLSNELSLLCNDLIAKVYKENDFKNARMLNLCNKQKTNTQKISKLGLIYSLNIGNQNQILKEMEETITSYEFSMSLLKSLTAADKDLSLVLSKNFNEWVYVKENFNLKNVNFQTSSLIENSDKILKQNMNFSDLVQRISIAENSITKL